MKKELQAVDMIVNEREIQQMTDEELARLAGSGSHAGFEELVYRYSGRLFHFLRERTGSIEDAEDLVQETFVKAYRNIERYDPAWKFSTWLYTIGTRLAVSAYRSRRPEELRLTEVSDSVDPQDVQDQLIRQEDSENLWTLARELKPDRYRALWLRHVEGMTVKEIAAVMKKTQIHVRVLLHRARSQLAKQLAHTRPGFLEKNGQENVPAPQPGLSFL